MTTARYPRSCGGGECLATRCCAARRCEAGRPMKRDLCTIKNSNQLCSCNSAALSMRMTRLASAGSAAQVMFRGGNDSAIERKCTPRAVLCCDTCLQSLHPYCCALAPQSRSTDIPPAPTAVMATTSVPQRRNTTIIISSTGRSIPLSGYFL